MAGVIPGSNRSDPNHALAAGSSFTPHHDDLEVVDLEAKCTDGPDRVAATESNLSPRFDETAPKPEPSSQRDSKAGAETSLGSGFASLSDHDLEGARKFDASFQPDSLIAKEAAASARPNITEAATPNSLAPVDGEATTGASTGPSLSPSLAEVPKFGSPSPTETVLARKSMSSSQPDVVVSVGMDSLAPRDLEGGTEASSEPRLDHHPLGGVKRILRPRRLQPEESSTLRNVAEKIYYILYALLVTVLFPIIFMWYFKQGVAVEDILGGYLDLYFSDRVR